jgi:hypothetical protein
MAERISTKEVLEKYSKKLDSELNVYAATERRSLLADSTGLRIKVLPN